MAPWELAQQPIYWQVQAEQAAAAEAAAEKNRQDQASAKKGR